MRAALVALAVAVGACPGRADRATPNEPRRPVDRPGVSLAIHHNLAVVRDVRALELAAGTQTIAWPDVARHLQPSTLRVTSLGDPDGVHATAHTIDAPIASGDDLLARGIGRPIAIRTRSGEVRGTLRAYDAAHVVIDSSEAGVRLVPRGAALESFALDDDGASATATARITFDSRIAGKQLVEVVYDTFGLHWNADYLLILENDDATRVELSGWATIWNESGVTYRDAWIQLSTLDPTAANVAQQANELVAVLRGEAAPDGKPAAVFESAPLAGVGPTTLADREWTRVSLIAPRSGVPARRRLVYDAIGANGIWRGPNIEMTPGYGVSDRTGVDEFLELSNDAASGLGRPLPAGRARVFDHRAGGALRWIGEADLTAAKAGDSIRLRLGPASGVRGTRKQIEFVIEEDRRRIVEEIEIALTNEEETPLEVLVLERFARGDTWKIAWQTHPLAKEDARTVRAVVTVPPRATERLRYRVIYGWR